MAEDGIDIAAEQPKILTTDAVKASDVVITMGCGDTCPFYPGKRYEDWVLDDPAGQDLDHVRPIRDQIRPRHRPPPRPQPLTLRRPAMADKPSVLFVCVHNAGRSQMAAGYLRHLAGDAIEVRSAGSEPADQINPVAVQAMAEDGIDITAEQPEDPHHRRRQSLRRRDHHGLRRHLPLLPRQTLRRLGTRRPRRPRPRPRPTHPRPDPPRIETLIAELLPART